MENKSPNSELFGEFGVIETRKVEMIWLKSTPNLLAEVNGSQGRG
jgi:hypothetical protein